ncbi:MAG: lysophospholipid acyltransferase family protein [Pseudonocardiales bacterium]|nr:lysophospholipid acyltransferase family protein [Pseudonocardiales bacterium]
MALLQPGGAHHRLTTWVPAFVCTPACLPEGGPRVGAARFGLRLAILLAVLVATAAGIVLLRGGAQAAWRRWTARAALRAAGVRLRTAGGPLLPGAGALVVANHLSWIDVLALDAVGPVRMLAKREVAGWPLLGGLAVRAGALFVDRAGLRSLPATVAETATALRSGSLVGVFPEGTTWCGAAAGTFRRAAFQAAVDAGVPVRPVAIVLRGPDGGPTGAGAFVGDQTLWDSLCRVLRSPGLECDLTLLPALPPHADRRALAAAAARAVGEVTGVPHPVPVRRPRAPVRAAA